MESLAPQLPTRAGYDHHSEDQTWSNASDYLQRHAGPVMVNLESLPERFKLVRRAGVLKLDSF